MKNEEFSSEIVRILHINLLKVLFPPHLLIILN